ncbi:hypothetical protein PGB90_008877 [Kerria lacca]
MDVSMKTFDDVLRKYAPLEFALEIKIKNVLNKIQRTAVDSEHRNVFLRGTDSWEEENAAALSRNKLFTKELELKKAKLRSSRYYQPASAHFTKLLNEYKNEKTEETSDFEKETSS